MELTDKFLSGEVLKRRLEPAAPLFGLKPGQLIDCQRLNQSRVKGFGYLQEFPDDKIPALDLPELGPHPVAGVGLPFLELGKFSRKKAHILGDGSADLR